MYVNYEKYEIIVGLEIHVQLNTLSKAYCSDSTKFGSLPNTNISPISLGHPGTLPVSNKKVFENAIKLGLALNCNISIENRYDRKNYFYPDLPKGYQITQDKTPICTKGFLNIKDEKENLKTVSLTRIHMEEDAGKSIHDLDPFDTLIDLNRAGVPLLEIVTDPVINSSVEAYNFISEIRKIVRYLDICDGNMEEGSMRCDANISVRLKGEKNLRNRVEVKNMNSIKNVQKAIDLEVKRQINNYSNEKQVNQETRSYDAINNKTFVLRSKEDAHDYRYFPEPDLSPVIISTEYIKKIKKEIPPLPQELYLKFTSKFNLSDYDSKYLTENKDIAIFFNEISNETSKYKLLANILMGPIKSYLNEHSLNLSQINLSHDKVIEVIDLITNNKISKTIAFQKLFPLILKYPEKKIINLINIYDLNQSSDEDKIFEYAKIVFENFPNKVIEYNNGNKNLIGLFMGEIMKLSKGKVNPKLANEILKNLLKNHKS